MAPAPKDRRGWNQCGICKSWKAGQAFVRSCVMRGSLPWKREGFDWKKFKTCNRCSRVYKKSKMSLSDFVNKFGAEEHNDSEPDLDTDDDTNSRNGGANEAGTGADTAKA